MFEPLDLIARLCALVPPPGLHMVRYHGVVPEPVDEDPPPPRQLDLLHDEETRLVRKPWARPRAPPPGQLLPFASA